MAANKQAASAETLQTVGFAMVPKHQYIMRTRLAITHRHPCHVVALNLSAMHRPGFQQFHLLSMPECQRLHCFRDNANRKRVCQINNTDRASPLGKLILFQIWRLSIKDIAADTGRGSGSVKPRPIMLDQIAAESYTGLMPFSSILAVLKNIPCR